LNYSLPLINIIKEAGIILKVLKKTTDILVLLSYIILGRNTEFFDFKERY